MIAFFNRLARTLAGLKGWRRNAAAFTCGALSTLTLAPFFAFPLLIPSFTGLLWLLDGARTRRRLFFDGWWWGWGFHMTGLYWFCVALLTDAENFAWLIPFALFGLTGVIALYSGIACWLMGFVRVRGAARIAAFAAAWTWVELARGGLFTGFPWNLAGYAFGFSGASLQMASLVGAYGLTFFAVLLGASLAACLQGRRGLMLATALWGLFFLGLGWGQWRLATAEAVPESERFVEGVMLRLVQADIEQAHKWDPALQMQGLQKHVQLTESPGLEKVTHVIWPETAVPYVLQEDSNLSRLLGGILPPGKILITGTLRGEEDKDGLHLWNSLMAIDHEGKIAGAYDKNRLVPFGEFQPLRRFVPKEWMTPVGDKDFEWGGSNRLLDWPGLPPLTPLICYEAIFPGMAQPPQGRPQMLINVTNDAWFGTSTGPHQHFHMARMRAVEQGVPLVRVANTGISAVIDPYGTIVTSLGLGKQGVLDSKLPKANNDATIFSVYSKLFLLLLMFISITLTCLKPIKPE